MELALKEFQQPQIWLDELFAKLANAELSRDLNSFQKLFSPFWQNLNQPPDFSEFGDLEQANLFRFAGAFLCHYGRAKSLKDYQERGKDLLSKAIDLFELCEETDKAYEARIILAYSYYYESRSAEFSALLEEIQWFYQDNKTNENYLLLQVNQLEWMKDDDLPNALKCINSIRETVNNCNNLKIKCQFHTQAGITFRRVNEFEKALFHYEQGIYFARRIGNKRFEANLLNNLSFLYRAWGNYDLAHLKVDDALALAGTLGDVGWQANYLDTKANIYFDQSNFDNALDVVNKAILFFPEGDDYKGYIGALWLKCKILFKQNLRELGFELFYNVIELSLRHLNEQSVKFYLSELAKIVHFPAGDGYKEQVKNFKHYKLETALTKHHGVAAEAARELKLSASAMSEILRNQFPELQKELEMKERHPRTVKTKPKSPEITSFVINKNTKFPTETNETAYYFKLPAVQTNKIFDYNADIILAVIPVDEIEENELFLYKIGNLRIGKTIYSDFWQIEDYLTDEVTELSSVKLYGKVIGHCPLSELENEVVKFYGIE